MKQLMTGDEAVARGAYEAGVRHASAYPGTPSTEILENLSGYDEIETEWGLMRRWPWNRLLVRQLQGPAAWCL